MIEKCKKSQPYRALWVYGILAWLIVAGAANAQTTQQLQFKAIVNETGNVELIPINTDFSTASMADAPAMNGTATRSLFLVKDAGGIVKGVYPNQAVAMDQVLLQGDSLQVLPAAQTVGFLDSITPSANIDDDMLEEVAKKATQTLLAMVKASACDFDPLPETISPTVEVSFSFFAGASLSIQATWITAKVCAK
jgi:archaellum component FlaG (FlaF/FlaG flagellin family)